MRTKNSFGILAVILLIGSLLAMSATPVSASVKIYGSGQAIWYDYSYPWWSPNYYHFAIIYNVPYSTESSYRPRIGGVDMTIVNQYVSADHKDVQSWAWKAYPGDSRKSMLLIPKTYVARTTSRYLPSEIYLEFAFEYWKYA